MDGEDHKRKMEDIVLRLGSIAADEYLGKDISIHLPFVEDSIQYINYLIDDIVPVESDLTEYLSHIGYQFYRLRERLTGLSS
jgi:hypothetical protein